MKKVSVIIPVYNVEKYLSECVDSVLHQSYQNFEIILVDDGSKDKSGEICDKYASSDSRISVIHKENGGASSARNVGMDSANGEYIFFLDSDDRIENTALEKLLTAITENDCDIAFCQAYAIDEDTERVNKSNYGYHRDYGSGSAQSFFSEMVKYKEFHVAVWMLLYKRAFLKKNKLRFVEGIMYEDCIFSFQVYSLAEKAVHVNEYLYYRRYRDNSVMTSKKTEKNFVSAVRAYYEVVAFSFDVSDSIATEKYLSRIAFNAVNNYRALSVSDKKKHRKEYRELKKNILENKSFGDRSLKASCHGKIFWIMYKITEKLFNNTEVQ